MPWCDECAKFWNPGSMREGECPTCGAVLGPPASKPDVDPHPVPTVPWHFKMMLVALIIYLGYRAYQGVVWVGHSWLHVF